MKQNDQDIINAIKENPETGFRQLMQCYMQPIYWHIRRIVVLHDDAQDVTQETLVRIFRSIGQFNGDSALSTWIYRIATNEALRHLSRNKKDTVSLDDEEATPANAMLADDWMDYTDLEAVKLQQAIRTLPTKQQLAFNLRYYDEMSYEEIAEITHSSAASVKSNYHFAKEKIINYLRSND